VWGFAAGEEDRGLDGEDGYEADVSDEEGLDAGSGVDWWG